MVIRYPNEFKTINVHSLTQMSRTCDLMCSLEPFQRKALLLSLKQEDGDTLLKTLLILKAIRLDQLIRALDLTEETFSLLFPNLPLNNAEISAFLNCKEEQVVKLIAIAKRNVLRKL
jgi:hypothetical protein